MQFSNFTTNGKIRALVIKKYSQQAQLPICSTVWGRIQDSEPTFQATTRIHVITGAENITHSNLYYCTPRDKKKLHSCTACPLLSHMGRYSHTAQSSSAIARLVPRPRHRLSRGGPKGQNRPQDQWGWLESSHVRHTARVCPQSLQCQRPRY